MENTTKWRNLGQFSDAEIVEINRIEKELGNIDENFTKIRELITRLEMCHHKSKRHVDLIIQAIGTEKPHRFPSKECYDTLSADQERWKAIGEILGAWLEKIPEDEAIQKFPDYTDDIYDFYNRLGDHNELKNWQVEHLKKRVHGHVYEDVEYRYLSGIAEADNDFLEQTSKQKVQMALIPGADTEFTLDAAIDNAVPCNWNFETNLRLILSTIGGKEDRSGVLAAHAANIEFNPLKIEMIPLVNALDEYVQNNPVSSSNRQIFSTLGERNPVKSWLAASLSKTIKVQLKIEI